MITINHYLRPCGGGQAAPLAADSAKPSPPEPLPIGLRATFAIHHRPDGRRDSDPDIGADSFDGWTWRFAIAGDWNPATPPIYLSTHVTHPSAGLWLVDLSAVSTRTTEAVLATSALGKVDVGFELAGIPDGGSWATPGFLLQWLAPLVGRRDSGASATPMPDDPLAGDALDAIRAALASIPAAAPTTAGDTAQRVAAVIDALKNIAYPASTGL